MACRLPAVVALVLCLATPALAAPEGYYRHPAVHGDTIVFVAEGDLWKVGSDGGVARRLTSHGGDESYPSFSPDGRRLGFLARYEGPTEAYTMPVEGGRPVRRSWGLGPRMLSGWKGEDRLVVSTRTFATLPHEQLVLLRADGEAAGVADRIPLDQAADGCWDGRTLIFTRLAFQGSHTKRYQGGTAQQIWSWRDGRPARSLTADYAGTSKRPMCWDGRVYFASDRDGTMNLWSMTPDGGDLQQHTTHEGFDLKDPNLHDGRVVYQHGADVWLHDLRADRGARVDIRLDSDLDQTRENWVDEPWDYVTSVHPSPDGDRVALTARGKVFVAPLGAGRLVQTGTPRGVRYRDARFMPGGKSLVALSDASGEVELWRLPANGVGDPAQWTTDGDVLRWGSAPSPDGKWIAHWDKRQRLFVLDVEQGTNQKIAETPIGDYLGLSWSPDSRWLAYVEPAANLMARTWLYELSTGSATPITTDRFNSYSPAWGPDGKFLYLLSDRNLRTVVGSPWGAYQPEPFLDRRGELYHLALRPGLRSPFAEDDELHDEEARQPDEDEDGDEDGSKPREKSEKSDDDDKSKQDESEQKPEPIEIDLAGIAGRLTRVPVDAGNYRLLTAAKGGLFWLSRPTGGSSSLLALKIDDEKPKPVEVTGDVTGYEPTADGKKLLVRKGRSVYVIDAKAANAKLDEAKVELDGWALSVIPREEWRQMYLEAWRLERDYFYATNMHGVDWDGMRDKYLPLVDRVTTRGELSDLISQMVGELSALHIFVRGGDQRTGEDNIGVASLGARLVRDPRRGGYRIDHIYASDPDQPDRRSPLAHPQVAARTGDVITHVNGRATLDVPDIGELLRRTAGKQVLLRLNPDDGEERDAIVTPLSPGAASDLRYHEWEFTRRSRVEEASDGDIGYVHLRAMGGRNYTEWARNYFPVFDRKGLVIDMRHNRGGNIDSWILNRLLRKAWFYWNQHAGQGPLWNMQYAFRGHIAVLVDEFTASDGEAFSEGIKRLDLGTVIGKRTWGGEIWLSSSNFLVDGGIATSAEFGVFGPQGEWLIEGHGVEPDMVVDNEPWATFRGEDAQLEAALKHLRERIAAEPIPDYPVPPFPDKSSRDNR